MARKTYDKPSDVVAEAGRVLMDGPGEVDVAYTPEAARETGGRLIGAAQTASSQQQQAEQDAGEPEPDDLSGG